MSEIKLTDQELKQIQDLRTKYATVTAQLGQLKVEQIIATEQINRLNELELEFTKEYLSIQAEEEKLAADITTKYGAGEIDVETGVFTVV
jgi:predicted transcriptional regulator